MKKYYSFILVLSLLFVGCSKDDDGQSDEFDGSIQAVTNFVGSDLLNVMLDLGLEINLGNNPPAIDGQFLLSPNILENSNIDSDLIGSIFPDHLMKFYDQRGLELLYSAVGGNQSDQGVGSLISGEGNKFSIYLTTESDILGFKASTMYVLSGKLTQEGFTEFQMAGFMKDNYGNPGGVFIENGKGRIFVDGDALVEKQ